MFELRQEVMRRRRKRSTQMVGDQQLANSNSSSTIRDQSPSVLSPLSASSQKLDSVPSFFESIVRHQESLSGEEGSVGGTPKSSMRIDIRRLSTLPLSQQSSSEFDHNARGEEEEKGNPSKNDDEDDEDEEEEEDLFGSSISGQDPPTTNERLSILDLQNDIPALFEAELEAGGKENEGVEQNRQVEKTKKEEEEELFPISGLKLSLRLENIANEKGKLFDGRYFCVVFLGYSSSLATNQRSDGFNLDEILSKTHPTDISWSILGRTEVVNSKKLNILENCRNLNAFSVANEQNGNEEEEEEEAEDINNSAHVTMCLSFSTLIPYLASLLVADDQSNQSEERSSSSIVSNVSHIMFSVYQVSKHANEKTSSGSSTRTSVSDETNDIQLGFEILEIPDFLSLFHAEEEEEALSSEISTFKIPLKMTIPPSHPSNQQNMEDYTDLTDPFSQLSNPITSVTPKIHLGVCLIKSDLLGDIREENISLFKFPPYCERVFSFQSLKSNYEGTMRKFSRDGSEHKQSKNEEVDEDPSFSFGAFESCEVLCLEQIYSSDLSIKVPRTLLHLILQERLPQISEKIDRTQLKLDDVNEKIQMLHSEMKSQFNEMGIFGGDSPLDSIRTRVNSQVSPPPSQNLNAPSDSNMFPERSTKLKKSQSLIYESSSKKENEEALKSQKKAPSKSHQGNESSSSIPLKFDNLFQEKQSLQQALRVLSKLYTKIVEYYSEILEFCDGLLRDPHSSSNPNSSQFDSVLSSSNLSSSPKQKSSNKDEFLFPFELGGNFLKRSTWKKHHLWQFSPTNLNTHLIITQTIPRISPPTTFNEKTSRQTEEDIQNAVDMKKIFNLPDSEMGNVRVYPIVTFGCFSAHGMKYHNGGLRRQICPQITSRTKWLQILHSTGGLSDDYVRFLLNRGKYIELMNIPTPLLQDGTQLSFDSYMESQKQSSRGNNLPNSQSDENGDINEDEELEDEDDGEIREVSTYTQISRAFDYDELELSQLYYRSALLSSRIDMVSCQALSVALNSFSTLLNLASLNVPNYFSYLCRSLEVGFLFSVESLISTQGNEMGMLEDMSCAIQWLNTVYFRLILPIRDKFSKQNDNNMEGDHSSSRSAKKKKKRKKKKRKQANVGYCKGIYCKRNREGKIIIDICITNPKIVSLLTLAIGACYSPEIQLENEIESAKCEYGNILAIIPLTAVLFSQGVNEMQTLANLSLSGETDLQYRINSENMRRLEDYYTNYKAG